ncbi:addiction module toxin RelE [Lentilactobacillus sp. IMAU92037]|uniref:type II toxin-antitoxin system RelE family toxin n=1 Tax=Lentilactobacillus TaxID=2767893 RepID=UPI001C2B8CE9|nr:MULTISPECIES: addiction module toxin RelE [Lentilactobacillus]MBV0930011.1 addiction module toxin RelE [Lentilactobacillus dabitei]MDM7515367.1 addiction module toxin RelE [Lentilactobacillus sp. TOM.63]
MSTPREHHLKYFRQAAKEKQHLDGSQLKVVNKGLKRIKVQGMQAGKPLTGNLAGCREIKHRDLGIRIIFRKDPSLNKVIDIVGIGKREDKIVYKEARHRIDHHSPTSDVDDSH